MTKKTQTIRPPGLTIDYSILGILTLDELKRAIWTDLEVLKEIYNVRYVTGPRLRFQLTNEFGDHANLKDLGNGKPIHRMSTRHFRPACKDYDL